MHNRTGSVGIINLHLRKSQTNGTADLRISHHY